MSPKTFLAIVVNLIKNKDLQVALLSLSHYLSPILFMYLFPFRRLRNCVEPR